MQDIQNIQFPNEGFTVCKLDPADLAPIWHEVSDIQKNFDAAVPYNNNLLGNIQHEYQLTHSLAQFESLAVDLAHHFESLIDPPRDFYMAGAWVNFQKKYEYNPPHMHDGVYVAVAYLQIPYTRQQEIQATPGVPESKNLNGTFAFQYTDALGRIRSYHVMTDHSIQDHMLLFPAAMIHSVYPFVSSDQYRISISGNIYLR